MEQLSNEVGELRVKVKQLEEEKQMARAQEGRQAPALVELKNVAVVTRAFQPPCINFW